MVTPTPCVLVLYTSVPDHNSILEQLNPQWNGKKPVIVAHEICCNTVNETLSSELSNMASHCSIPNIVSRNLQGILFSSIRFVFTCCIDLFSERLDHYLFGSVALDRNFLFHNCYNYEKETTISINPNSISHGSMRFWNFLRMNCVPNHNLFRGPLSNSLQVWREK